MAPPDDAAERPHAIQVEAAEGTGCALLSDGTVWCWGSNITGLIAAPPTKEVRGPTRVAGIDEVVSISVGNRTACAVKRDGSVWCWGRNTFGELGRLPESTPTSCGGGIETCDPTPTKVPGVSATMVSVGTDAVCAVTTDKAVMCWGFAESGICGATSGRICGPTVVSGLANIERVALGYKGQHACAIDEARAPKNERGALGTGVLDAGMAGPAKIKDGGLAVVDVAVGPTTCAVTDDGAVWCWGRNAGNELELPAGPDDAPHPDPVEVRIPAGAARAKSVRRGNSLCALFETGQVWCWGPGRLVGGMGTTGCKTPSSSSVECYRPAAVPGPPLSSFDVDHLFAVGIARDGGVVAWGDDGLGRLGYPGDGAVIHVPTPVSGLP